MYKSKDTGFNGVLKYIYDNHLEILPKVKDPNQLFSFVKKIQRKFLNHINVKYVKNKEYIKTQENWNEFKIFLKRNY